MSIADIYELQDKPLYCFKVNPETGQIKKITIPRYNIKKPSHYTSRLIYIFGNCISNDGKTYRITSDKLDRFVGNKLFTFNGSILDAREVITDTLLDQLDNLEDKLIHTQTLYNKVVIHSYSEV